MTLDRTIVKGHSVRLFVCPSICDITVQDIEIYVLHHTTDRYF